MIATPDYGLSDIWHFNYPLKNLLSESLKSGKFPLWTDLAGNGFPIAAEGQIGAFSPLNWLIFGIFPMPSAFLIALAAGFILLFSGTYAFSRSLGLSRPAALAAGLFSSLSGYFIVQMTHVNLLQSFSFIPWAFFCVEKFISARSRPAAAGRAMTVRPYLKHILWLAMVLAQMILVGYPQTFFNTVIMLEVYVLARLFFVVISTERSEWRNPAKRCISSRWPSGPDPSTSLGMALAFIGAAAVGAVLLAAVQVLPLLELAGQSDTIAAAARQRFIHPLPFKHLLTVINPFLFGDPSRGTYPAYGEQWGMFWENMLYVGIIPIFAILLFFAVALFSFCHSGQGSARSRIKSGTAGGILAVFVISLLLSLGKYTPLSLLFKLPPLSFTRISSRFLAFSNFSLGILGAYCLAGAFQRIAEIPGKKRWFPAAFLTAAALHLVQIGWTFGGYHLWVDGKRWLQLPVTAGRLAPGARIVSLGQSDRWNKTFLTDGWRGKEDEYYQNRNSLDPNSNMIFGVRQLGVYAQQLPRRQEIIQRNMYGDDILGRNIRDVFGVTDIIDAKNDFEIMENKAALPDIRIGARIVNVKDMREALGIMNQEAFHSQTDVLWESEAVPKPDEEIVVVNRSFYPGWRAWLSGKEIPIYPANINQQAVIIPKDAKISNLAFQYDPWSYKIGGIISVVSLTIWGIRLRRFSVQ